MENEGQLFEIGRFFCSQLSLCFSVFICFVFTEAVAFFKKCMVDDPGMSTAVAAIQTLLEFMNQNAGKLVILKRK